MKKLITILIVANILCGSYILWNTDYAQTKPTIIVVDVPVPTTVLQPKIEQKIPAEAILQVENYPEVSIVKTYEVKKTQNTKKTANTLVNNFSRHTRPDSSFVYYDFIPLSRELQEFTWRVSREYNIDVLLVYAVMKLESRFITDLVSDDGNDFGLMQINKVNHQWLSDKLGITDYLNPYDNIVAGVYILRHALNEGDNLHTSLMVYNCGIGRAKELWAEGVYSNTYSHIVVGNYEEYLNEAEH